MNSKANMTMESLEPFDSFRLVIEPLSDWHVGTGAGIQGYIDRTVVKDHDGMPQLGAKTVFGILRDSCETVAYGLDNRQDNGYWSQVLRYLFGKNNEGSRKGAGSTSAPGAGAALSVGTARFSQSLREKLLDDYPKLKAELTFVQPSVKINKKTGQSQEKALRFTEMVRAGIPLYSSCELVLPKNDNDKRACCALLVTAASFMHHFGAGRRRGAGKCRAYIDDASSTEKWLEWLKSNISPAGRVDSFGGKAGSAVDDTGGNHIETATSMSTEPTEETDADTGWRRIVIRINIEEPLQIFARKTGNVVQTLDFIPGTYLLRLLYRLMPEEAVNRVLSAGKLLVTDATPDVWVMREDGGRLAPQCYPGFRAPMILGCPKQPESEKAFVLKSYRYERAEEAGKKEILEPLSGNFLAWDEASALPFKTPITHNTHNAVLDKSQRPESDTGGIFSYQAIAPACTMTAEIRYQSDVANEVENGGPDAVKGKLEGGMRLGRSRKDYGAVTVGMVSGPEPCATVGGDLKAGAISTIMGDSDNGGDSAWLTVWLLSDLLIDDGCGRREPLKLLKSTLEQELSDSLGNSVRISPVEAEYDSEIFHTSIRPVRRDSWHAGWGLPRPTLSGLAAGSVAAFKVEGLGRKKDRDKVELLMRKLEATGIGDRRAEGFGQLCFNHFFTTKKLFMIPAAASIYNRRPRTIRAGGEIAEGDQQSELFDLLGRAALSNEIRKKAMEVASDADKCKEHLGFEIEKGKSRPTLSRIGLFRMLLQHVEAIPEKGCTADENDPHEDKSVAVKWFEHARKKDEKKKWEGSPSEKLKKLVCGNNNDDIWSVLGINLFQFGVGNEDDEIIRKEFAPEAVRVFFDACARAHKREYERMKKGGNTGGNDSSESGQKEQDDGA